VDLYDVPENEQTTGSVNDLAIQWELELDISTVAQSCSLSDHLQGSEVSGPAFRHIQYKFYG